MGLEAVNTKAVNTNLIRQPGFTLLEILIVIGILAILLSIGFPQYAAYQRGLVMRDVSNQIAQSLRETGARAKAETTALTVNFRLNQPEGDDLTFSDGKTPPVKLEGNASITAIDGGTSVEFDVRGRPSNTKPIVIHATFADRTATVRLLTTGKTVIQ
jgi:prepilin-type N-terminal cleavage/methylation domain-containing protein